MSVRRALHEPRIPPAVVRTYKRKNLIKKKWPAIAKPPLSTRQWRHYDTNVCLLDAQLPASTAAVGHADAAIAVAAVAYAHCNAAVDKWRPADVERIIGIGNHLHRRSLNTAGVQLSGLRPPDVLSTFFIGDSRKVQTMVAVHAQLEARADLLAAIRECLALGFAGCIVGYNRHRYAAVWQVKRCLYVFYPEKNWCLCVSTDGSFQQLVPQLMRSQRFRLFGMKILQMQEVQHRPTELDEEDVMQRLQHRCDTPATPLGIVTAEEADTPPTPTVLNVDLQELMTTESSLGEALNSIQPYLVEFQQSFVPLPAGHGHILRASGYVDAGERIAGTNVAAIAMLCIARAFTWTTDTVDEVLLLGQQIHEEATAKSRSKDSGAECMQVVELATRTKRIRIGRDRHYTVEAEQTLFGELMSVGDLPDLQRALELFFDGAGEPAAAVVQGPQAVAVWHELGFYYMFDAKERDRFGRKWTASTAAAVAAGADAETAGSGCVTRFGSVGALVALYSECIALKHRHDAYRIVSVLVQPCRERSDDWHRWAGIAVGRWLLRGRCSQASARFAEDQRNRQAVCIAAMALWQADTRKMAAWTAQVVDDIVVAGDELHAASVEQMVQRDADAFAEGPRRLRPAEISRRFRAKGEDDQQQQPEIEFTVVEAVLVGALPVEQTFDCEQPVGLVADVVAFFGSSSKALLSVGDETYAVWHCDKDDVYYVFDAQPRDELGRSLLANSGGITPKAGMLGTACVQRFGRLVDLVQSVLNNLRLRRDQMPVSYSLSRISMNARPEPGQTTNGENGTKSKYRKFGEVDGADILRGAAGQQEGNHTLFALRADKQTLCNLLTMLCWSKLTETADTWTPADLAEILRQGDRMYVAQTVSRGSDVLDDFRVMWEHVLEGGGEKAAEEADVEAGEEREVKVEKGTINIGTTRFAMDVRREVMSPLVNPEPPVEELIEEEGEEGEGEGEDDVDGEAGVEETVEPEVTEENVEGEGDEGVEATEEEVEEEEEEVEPPPDLKTLLTTWSADSDDSSTDKKMAIIDSAVVQLAVWQHNSMFYVFDPKANDASAMPTPKRRQGWNKLIEAAEAVPTVVEITSITDEQTSIPLDGDVDGAEGIETVVETAAVETAAAEEAVVVEAVAEGAVVEETVLVDTEVIEGEKADNEEAEVAAEVKEVEKDLSHTDEPKSATCYVLRFSTIDDVIDHLMAVIPEPLHTFQPIEFVNLNIAIEPLKSTGTDSDNYFNFAHNSADNVWQLRASMSQNDRIFPNRNSQAAANCIVCASMATVLSRDKPAAWTSALLDVILKYGDRLNTKSMKPYRVNGQPPVDQLNLHQICTPFVLASVRFAVDVKHCAAADLTIDGNVSDVLDDFFKGDADKATYGILYTNGRYVAVWSAAKSFFLFVPHAIECGGVATLQRCDAVDALSSAIMRVLHVQPVPPECSAVQLFRIRVESTQVPAPKRSPSLTAVHSAYTQNANGQERLLLGTISERSGQLKHFRPAPSACHAIAALATSLDQSADYWTPHTVDQILRLGCDLFDQIDATGDTTAAQCGARLSSQQVCKQFCMHGGRVAVHVQLEQKLRGAVCPAPASAETSLKSALWRLLASESVRSVHAVLTTHFCTLALWKENGHLFVFSGKPLGGVASITVACVYRFESVHEMYATIVTNEMVESAEDLGGFEIRLCDITLQPVREERAALQACGRDVANAARNKPQRKGRRRQTQCDFRRISPVCSVLRSTVAGDSVHVNQTAAIGLCAVAMSCVQLISGWTERTVNVVQLAGGRLHADAQRLRDDGVQWSQAPPIRLQHLPREICIGDVRLELSVSAPQRIDATDEGRRRWAEFVEQQTMAYVEAADDVGAYVMLVHPPGSKFYYVVDAMPERPIGPRCVAVCVWRFKCVPGMWTHLTKGGRCGLMVGAIRCVEAMEVMDEKIGTNCGILKCAC